jgi:beta-xylosidase
LRKRALSPTDGVIVPGPFCKFAVAALALLAGLPNPAAAADQPSFVPVYRGNFPDPFILPHGAGFLAYATNAEQGRANVQMAASTNLVDWQPIQDGGRLHDAMPVLPSWAREGWTWAPEVMRNGERYLLYFTAKERRGGLQCVGVAEARDPLGPFTSAAAEPLICQRDIGGTIDASPFRDADGRLYLYFKNDGNNQARAPVRLYVQPLAADGLSMTGTPTAILDAADNWEERLVEAPTMVHADGGYFLFFSAGFFGWPDHQNLSPYAMGYATCRSALGPCEPARGNPILHGFSTREAGCLSGPGHQSIFEARGRYFLSFHAWSATSSCRRADPAWRNLYIAPLSWREGAPVIGVSLRPPPEDHR